MTLASQSRFLVGILLFTMSGCDTRYKMLAVNGNTMGTVYQVQAECPRMLKVDQLEIDTRLEWVNDIMSTYRHSSTLSRFNRADTNKWISVEPELVYVMEAALALSSESDGAFDITVGALVNLWGFGPEPGSGDRPSGPEIQASLNRVGYQYLLVRQSPAALYKKRAIYVDLSAIAKGYGVDYLAEYLSEGGCINYLVEIGGEVRTKGVNPRSTPWRIGIEVPETPKVGRVQRVVELTDAATATSGDYRNLIEWDGKKYSHTIDPRTGYPVQHKLASVTVIHQSSMTADALATLLNVLGPEEGMVYAQDKKLAALFVSRAPEGFQEQTTAAFNQYLLD